MERKLTQTIDRRRFLKAIGGGAVVFLSGTGCSTESSKASIQAQPTPEPTPTPPILHADLFTPTPAGINNGASVSGLSEKVSEEKLIAIEGIKKIRSSHLLRSVYLEPLAYWRQYEVEVPLSEEPLAFWKQDSTNTSDSQFRKIVFKGQTYPDGVQTNVEISAIKGRAGETLDYFEKSLRNAIKLKQIESGKKYPISDESRIAEGLPFPRVDVFAHIPSNIPDIDQFYMNRIFKDDRDTFWLQTITTSLDHSTYEIDLPGYDHMTFSFIFTD